MVDINFHNLIMITQSVIHKNVFMKLGETNLSLGQPKVLDYLGKHDGCVQKDIAISCQIEPATVTSLLSRMEESGLIERKSLNGNRRSLYVYLTEHGKEMYEKVKTVFDEVENVAFEGFSEKEREEIIQQLYKIYSNISKEN
jgi:DNA-binding MarR family transcriptional regulator